MEKVDRILLTVVMIAGLVFALCFRASLTDKTQGTRLEGFYVAELFDVESFQNVGAREYFENYAMRIQEELDGAQFLITCVPTGDVKYDYGFATTTVKVTSVLRGEGISAGDVIRVFRGGWQVYYDRPVEGNYIDLGFSTFFLGGGEYLLFLSQRMDVNEIKYGRVYEIPQLLILPAFCLEERQRVVIEPTYGNGNYVPLEPLRGNEFLAASESTMDGLLEYKRLIIERYAPQLGAFESVGNYQ